MEEFSSSEIIYDDVIQRLFCDDVTQRLFWMMSYKGYFGICFEYREQRTTVKIREITERRRLGEVSDQEKSPRYIKFQYDFRLDLQNDRKLTGLWILLDLRNDRKTNRTLDHTRFTKRYEN
ncbi:hypothetical protein AT1G05035 [Arabidopsis thaliana]|uniref:Uncharacterized protein n=1 Tax=Arabidopsis thaliana TaxID=3702 RepID=A0A1P8ANE6_ARATH|nr:uncharacterized protein AT1G05035 [Arabidopsis thaliana]ANM58171.1 hypothetical protein AT1G05035 [Arabidopsis thaliana]|eukprot:NP_001320626.1 hypothetical protein AT1G05035 [Arabidopsis thaliana]